MKPQLIALSCWLLVLCAATSVVWGAEGSHGKHKVLFLAGKPSHGYGAHDHLAGCMLLSKSLNESGLPVESRVVHYDWPKDAEEFEDIDCIVMYGDGGARHMVMEHLDEVDALAKKGVGIVCLHYAVEIRSEERRVGKECRSRWWP